MDLPNEREKAPVRLQPTGAKSKEQSNDAKPLTGSSSQINDEAARAGLSTSRSAQHLGAIAVSSPDKFFGRLVKVIAPWFAVVVALTYGAGYLTRHTFLSWWGIREAGGDFLRPHYIYVGILFMLFPVTIIVPLVTVASLRHLEVKLAKRIAMDASSPHRFLMPVPSCLMYLNMGWVFYVGILFTPKNFFFNDEKEFLLPIIFVVSLVGPLLLEAFVEKYIVTSKSEGFSNLMRWVLCVAILVPLDYFAFRGTFADLWRIFWGGNGWVPSGAIYYFLFMTLVPYTVWAANYRGKRIGHARGRREIRLAAVGLALMFFFLGIVTFAVRVYPHVPTAKGGGYIDTPCVNVLFHKHPELSDEVKMSLSYSNRFVIIEQTAQWLYVANTHDMGGPKKWKEMNNIPKIIQLRVDTVEAIHY